MKLEAGSRKQEVGRLKLGAGSWRLENLVSSFKPLASCFLLLASCFLLLSACAHTGKVVKISDGVHKETLDEKTSAEVYLHFLKGEEFALRGDYAKARTELDIVINANPENGYLYYEIASDEADQKHFEEAIEACEKALELSPKLVQARLLLARLYSMQEKHAEAVNILEDTIHDFPSEYETYSLLAREYIALKRYNEAVGVMHRVLATDPESNIAYFYLGMLYGTFLKQYDKALSAYQRILEVEPDNIQIHAAVAQIYLDRGQVKKALDKLLEMENISAEDVSIQLRIALVYYQLKDYSKAAERFEKVLVSNPESDKIRYYLGMIYAESDDMESAIRHFKQVPVKSNFYREANISIAQYYNSHGRRDEAVKGIENAIREKPDEADFYLFFSAIFEQTKEYEKMVDVLKKGALALPESEKIIFSLGVMYDKLGQTDKAIETMKKVLELNSKNASALNYIGYTYAERGENLNEAENMLQDAASLKPNDGYIIDSLGWLYFKKGDLTKALELLTQAAKLVPKESTVYEHLGDLHKLRNALKQALNAYKRALKLAKEKKEQDEKEIKRLEEKICEVGGC